MAKRVLNWTFLALFFIAVYPASTFADSTGDAVILGHSCSCNFGQYGMVTIDTRDPGASITINGVRHPATSGSYFYQTDDGKVAIAFNPKMSVWTFLSAEDPNGVSDTHCKMTLNKSVAEKGVPPKFSDYTTEIYKGQLKIPNYYQKTDDGWRDDMGKLVAPLEINFAGKYYIGLHSCGAGCRYYTLSDLSSGTDSSTLDIFSNADGHSQKISDSHEYTSTLVSRANSKMLIAQYHIEQTTTLPEECRERIFVLSDDTKSIKPITDTIKFCQKR
ncbi:hypothetical protein [Paraburkholderia acidipaludis]|uniref:hypothetical protein n=1 Tax=Paraburkholderia acidipaludis TaxID=660537 RepID=UPI001FE22992|nr:hypothetical protein [Paraburkholderia acidipaludis]